MSGADGTALLLARADDLLERAQAGELTHTAFLTPGEQKQLLRSLGHRAPFLLDGGYAEAERRRAFFLPAWMTELDESTRAELLAEQTKVCLVPLEICGSGFRNLSHKDFLGAVLNLGIERSAIGDLCVLDAQRAVLFCDRTMATFLTEHLTRVANDAVRVTTVTLAPNFDGGRSYLRITDTVASPRADGVVAALANLSREKARGLFEAKMVEIEYEMADKPDRPVAAGEVIVIRGKGKFIIRSLSDQTKKGRYRLLADKYL